MKKKSVANKKRRPTTVGSGRLVRRLVEASKVIGKWCHVGRINTPGRLDYFEDLGADSCDGTGLAQYSHMRKKIYEQHNAPALAL